MRKNMKTKNVKKSLAVFVSIFVTLVALAGCSVPVASLSAKASTAQLVVTAGNANARTVMPSDMIVGHYTLDGTMSDGTIFDQQTSTDGTFTVSGIAVGDWTLTVVGYADDGSSLYTGTASVTISAEESKTVPITLVPVTDASGYGTLSITISWPAGKTIDAIDATAVSVAGDYSFTPVFTIDKASSKATCNVDQNIEVYPCSAYLVTLVIKSGSASTARTLTETAVVASNHTTSWTYALSDSDFRNGVFYHLGPEGAGTVPVDGKTYASGDTAVVLDNTDNTILKNDADDPTAWFIVAWNTAEDGGGTSYPVGSSITMADTPVNLYPVWKSTNGLVMNGTTVTYYSDTSVTSIDVPEGATAIAIDAGSWSPTFQWCSDLKSISLPSTLKSITAGNLMNCYALTSITVAADNQYFAADSGCLYSADKTVLIAVPAGLTSVSILPTVTEIGAYAFHGCYKLTSLTLPSGLTKIDDYAFYGCCGLKTMNDDSTVAVSDTMVIPSNVVSIGSYAFWNIVATKLVCNAKLESIGSYAFAECIYLETASITAATIGDYAFLTTTDYSVSPRLKSISFTGTRSVGSYAFKGQTALSSVSFENANNAAIGDYAFSGCKGITSVSFSGGIASIGASAFSGCTKITSVSFQEGLTSIGASAFYSCTGITSVSLPTGLTSIGASAFSNCTGITNINLPTGLKSIGDTAFMQCKGITSVDLPEGLVSVGTWAFVGCAGTTSLTIPASVTTIGGYAFGGWKKLTTVTLLSSTPPTCADQPFTPASATYPLSKILVPADAVAKYQSDAIWSKYASMIVGAN
jgi:hypothetical protein